MERINYSPMNPQQYEIHLSAFGKKVLRELMKQWAKEKEQKKPIEYRQITQNKRILNFHDNSLSNRATISTPSSPPIQMYFEENTFNINPTDDIVSKVATIEDLTISLQESINDNEFVHPTIVSSNIVQLCNIESHNELDASTDKTGNMRFHDMDVSRDNEKETLELIRKEVSWENMLDSELLFDFGKDIINVKSNAITNVTDGVLAKENITNNLELKVLNKDKGKKTREKRIPKGATSSKLIKKPKKENVWPNDEPMKVNKPTNSGVKNSFRKEKYTKTVKRWLDDVDTTIIPPSEDIDKENNNLSDDKENTRLNVDKQVSYCGADHNGDNLKITFDKTEKANKKVVQAQLANKDGVMKFAKPKKPEVKDTDLAKDKKEKVAKKFVPPIKSQIPVRDVTYEIITVDDRNVNKCCDALIDVTEEVFAVLIYSNGFCQLNSQFTDGTCSADGILFGTGGDIFYFFKNAGQKLKEGLSRLFTNKKLVISYEARTILIYLISYLQMEIKAINMYDAKIGASLLDPDNSPENFSDVQKLLSFTAPYTIATECTLQKAAWYMSLLKECWLKLKDVLVENQLWQVFVQIEMKLLPIIAEMEHHGVSIDLSKLKSMEETLMARMKLVEQECYKAAGKVFQINSTVQVRNILYDELQLDAKCNVKIRETLAGGLKSTSETMLRSLMTVHPLPKLILEYRHLHKAHATFLAGIAQQVKDGIVRPTWVQTAAATGRIASNNPNLQAIPKTPFSLVMFPEAEDTDGLQLNFRSVYVSRPGYTFLAADFKHVECRVFAHAAADTGLLRALTHSDDLFRVLAAQWLNKPESMVTSAERERTKRLVYASLYGAGTRKLMEILDVNYEQALQVAASFNRTFPSLKSFGRHVVSQCSQAGGRLSTLCGRVRRFANISSEDFNMRSHAERQAVNFIIQGSAADLCKIAMIFTEQQLRCASPRVEARLVLQIHDELVWEVSDQHVLAAAGVIKRVMEGCGQQCGMSLSLPVAVTVGKNWGEMEDLVVMTAGE